MDLKEGSKVTALLTAHREEENLFIYLTIYTGNMTISN